MRPGALRHQLPGLAELLARPPGRRTGPRSGTEFVPVRRGSEWARVDAERDEQHQREDDRHAPQPTRAAGDGAWWQGRQGGGAV